MCVLTIAGFLYWLRWFGAFRISSSTFATSILFGTILAMSGGHLAYLMTADATPEQLRVLLLTAEGWRAGYSSAGVVAGFGLAVTAVALIFRYPVMYLGDLFAPGIFGFSIVWRLGCYFDGCCFGAATSLPWGISSAQVPGLTVHPTQLYEAAASLLLFTMAPLILRWSWGKPGSGMLMVFCLLGYSVSRLIVDNFRLGASLQPVLFGMSLSQLVAAGLVISCSLTAWRKLVWYRAGNPDVAS
jgi:phosphatidylglycerol:prolipoprotein diacylglycerol transferase